MKAKKMFLSVMLIATVMLFFGGCGKQAESVSTEPKETAKEVDFEESMEESLEPTPSPTVESEESMGSSEAPDNSEKEADAEDEAVVEDEADMKKSASTRTESAKTESIENASSGTESNNSTTSNPANDNSTTSNPATNSSQSSGSASNSSQSNGNVQPSGSTGSTNSGSQSNENVQPSQPAAPTHTHSWKEHYATKQVWVPNIVVVDDYEDQITGKTDDVAICDCGFTTTDSGTIAQHVRETMHGFTIQPGHTVIERVKVGSHEEDLGHYEDTSYVDYYYCDCGATK